MQNALNQSPLYGAVILNRKPGNESQCVEAGVSLFTINSGDPRGTAELITEKRFCFSLSPAWRNRDHPPGGTTQDKDSDEAKKQKMLPRLQWACVIRGLEGRGKRPESQDEQRRAQLQPRGRQPTTLPRLQAPASSPSSRGYLL